MKLSLVGILLVAIALATGCTSKPKNTVWIYTSLYNNVVQDLDAKLKAHFPDVSFQWYQSGSENVAAKVNSEWLAGKTQADLLLTSDPFWYEELKKQGKLFKHLPPESAHVPAAFVDPDGYYAGVRMPIMVIGYNSEAVPADQAPHSFEDLTKTYFKNKIAMGSPLESGTSFTTAAMLAQHKGWEYFKKLRENGLLCSGGNSAVMGRMETKERPVGIILYENLLAEEQKNPQLAEKIHAVIPSDGAVLIPSPVAITASTKNPELSKQVYDYLFSQDAQASIVKGNMHGLSSLAPPLPKAPELSAILKQAYPWTAKWVADTFEKRAEIKKKFSEIVLGE